MRQSHVGSGAALLALAALSTLAAGTTAVPADEPIVRPRPKNKDVIAAPASSPAANPGTGVVPAPKRIGDALRNRSDRAMTRRPIDDAVALVRNLTVEPRASSAAFSFSGPPETVPILELAEAPPVQGPDGRWGFPPGRGGTAYPVGGDKAKGEYRLDLQDRRELQPAATYYYVLNVRSNSTDPNALRQQYRGKFDTVSQTVRVFFQRIEVLNDSDPAGDGELTFAFWANDGDTPAGRRWLGDREPLHWGDDSHHEIEVVLEIPNAPDQLTIQVDGYDDDGNLFQAQPYKSAVPLTAPVDSGGDERNLARRSFDLSHTKNNELFGLISLPNGGDKGDLAFSVIGHIEIARVSGGASTPPDGPPPASRPGVGITTAPRRGTGDRNYVRRPGGVVDRIPADRVVKQDPPAPFVTADGVTGQFQVLIPASRETGTTTIKWDAGAETEAKLFIRMGEEPESLFDVRPRGFKEFDIELGGKYSFRLHKEGRRTPLLAFVDISGERPRQKPPVFEPTIPGPAHKRLAGAPGAGGLTDRRPTSDVVRELKPPYITANDTADTVAVTIPKDQTSGQAGIAWDAGRYTDARVYLQIDDGKETLFDDQYRGRKRTEIEIGKTYTFRLHNPRGRGGVFAQVVVTGHRPGTPAAGALLPDTFRPGGVIADPQRVKLEDMATGRPPQGSGGVGLEPRKGGDNIRDRLTGPRTRLPVDTVSTLITNLRVLPSASNVVVTFNGPPNTVPLLEICKAAPAPGADGRLAFPAGQGATTYPVGGNKAQGEFKIDIGFITELEPDTHYHYLLNLRTHNTDPNARRQQVQGKFRTISQTVRITFSSIHVENDSDPGSNGDLTFVFWANGGGTDGGEKILGAPPNVLDWGEGDHDVNIVLEIPNAPDQLSLQVDGYDDDTVGTPIGAPSRTPLTAPRDTGVDERNLARLAFDLSQDFDGRTTRSFQMKSIRAGGRSEGDLLFEVYGTVEVIRSREIAEPRVSGPAAPAGKARPILPRRQNGGVLRR